MPPIFQLTVFLLIINFIQAVPLESPRGVSCVHGNCPNFNNDKVNVHLVAHSHDDAGWLQTFDDYYAGQPGGPGEIYETAGVKYILDSTFESLKLNPNRRYIQVETSFLWKWWQLQNETTKNDYRDLVNNGQIEIINGGWTMNDEAAGHYHSIIDQFTWGFRKLSEMIGSQCAFPKTGWQIDPFGHSREHAWISKQLGFDGMIIGRIDYRDKDLRKSNRSLDFMWNTSDDLDDSELFTSMFPDFYVSVSGFCFDYTCYDSITDSNLRSKVDAFASVMNDYRKFYRTKNILIPMGGDFHFQTAETNFAAIDMLIEGFKDHEDYNVFYSTPSCYIQSVKNEIDSDDLPKKNDDFFPYASGEHEFWTGYFSSRPTLKRFERLGNNILQISKQLASFSKSIGENRENSLESLRGALGLMQHHDAITGTEKQRVADDYAKLLSEGIAEAEGGMSSTISNFLNKYETQYDLKLSTCLLSNVTICQSSGKDKFLIVVYNPLGKTTSHYVRIPVNDGTYEVHGPDYDPPIITDVLDAMDQFDFMPGDKLPKELVFKATDLPPLGLKLYFIEKVDTQLSPIYFAEESINNDFGTKSNGFTIDPITGRLNSIRINGDTLKITQTFLTYKSNSGHNGKASGAYVFRPSAGNATEINPSAELSQQRGQLVDELKQKIRNNLIQIIRVYKGDTDEESYIEFDWLVGDLNQAEEMITRFTVDESEGFSNGGIFYTDSNGRQQIKRTLNKRNDYEYDPTVEPVTSNYYPITSRIVIKDEVRNLEVAVLNDRAQGGSSLRDGELELMIHRRCARDDGFGVSEVLNEQQFNRGLFARGQHYLTFGPIHKSSKSGLTFVRERELALKKLLAPLVMISNLDFTNLDEIRARLTSTFKGLSQDLPPNVHIMTLEPWEGDSYVLRLEHFIEKGDDELLAQNTSVKLKTLFNLFDITDVVETTLGANEKLNDLNDEDDFEVTLSSMQIRTFIIQTVNRHRRTKSILYNIYQKTGIDLI